MTDIGSYLITVTGMGEYIGIQMVEFVIVTPTDCITGNKNNHAGGTELINASEADHKSQTPGYTGDTKCLGCGDILSYGQAIDPGAHIDADGKWESDATDHFHTCACGHIFDRAAHGGGTATCHEKAKCEICGAEHGTVDKNSHTGGTELINASEADHKSQTPGYTGDTKCLGCGDILSYGQTIDPGAHIPSESWKIDGTHHRKVCAVEGCGAVIEGTEAEHSFIDSACTVCGAVKCTADSFLDPSKPVTLRLLDAQGNEIAVVETTDGSYILAVPNGSYTLEASKENHVTRCYSVTVDNGYVSQSIKLHLKGDINGDGRVNTTDVGRMNAHAKKANLLW